MIPNAAIKISKAKAINSLLDTKTTTTLRLFFLRPPIVKSVHLGWRTWFELVSLRAFSPSWD